ncbi:MAG TPA: hypothetical protein VEO73_01115 [Gemmatimonadales bacterium]|nr:hypothetical protein [Gemmatimonadales bacterium]
MIVTLVILGVLVLLLAWFLLSGRDDAPEPTVRRRPGGEDEIDHAELEEAERDVQEAAEEDSVRDWGPGVRKPPII